jgi:putative flippase GtrA
MNKRIREIIEIPMIRYLVMALLIVGLEVLVYYLLNSILGVNYLLAVPLSMALSIVLNWYFSKRLVFKQSRYKNSVELSLVAISSVIGVGIQLAVTYVAVEMLQLIPLLGKIIAITITFFWNFYVRKRYIFKA